MLNADLTVYRTHWSDGTVIVLRRQTPGAALQACRPCRCTRIEKFTADGWVQLSLRGIWS